MPYAKMESVPEPATRADMDALTEDKRGRIFAPSKLLKGGERVGLRLDIPAYRDHGTWIVAIHEPRGTASAGKSLGYESVAMVRNASFESNAVAIYIAPPSAAPGECSASGTASTATGTPAPWPAARKGPSMSRSCQSQRATRDCSAVSWIR
jgi:hypothetical protein